MLNFLKGFVVALSSGSRKSNQNMRRYYAAEFGIKEDTRRYNDWIHDVSLFKWRS